MLHFPSAILYGVASSLMMFSTKFLMNNWSFYCPVFLILIEMLLNVITIIIIGLVNLFDIQIVLNVKNIFELSVSSRLKYQVLIALLFSVHSVLSLKSLSELDIPIYIMFRRLVPLINLIISFFLFSSSIKKRHSLKITFSILGLTLGVLLGGIGDINFEFYSYLYCGLSIIFQAFYLSAIQKTGESEKNSLQLLYECSLLSVPLLLIIFFVTKEMSVIAKTTSEDGGLYFWFIFTCVITCGSLLCFTQFWCTIKNDAITTSVIGVLKSIVQTLIGIIIFQSYKQTTVLTYVGLAVNITSGICYTYFKYTEKETEEEIPFARTDFQSSSSLSTQDKDQDQELSYSRTN